MTFTHPVAVKDDDCISSCEVDPKSSCSGAQQEQEHIWIFGKLGYLGKKNSVEEVWLHAKKDVFY